MGRQAVTISFRLGGDDGVSVEARKWEWALRELGFDTRRVAGTIEDDGVPDDIVVPSLAIDAAEPPDEAAIRTALRGADLVIVDNICSLPLNVEAARAVARVVSNHTGRVLFRHHDLPWQRRNLQHLESEFPPRLEGAMHATVNLRSRRELEARGFAGATTVHNYFDLDPPPGDRAATRKAFGFADDEFVLFQPARHRTQERGRWSSSRATPAPTRAESRTALLALRSGRRRLCTYARTSPRSIAGGRDDGSRRQRGRCVRGRRSRGVPVDVGRIRQSDHRVDRLPARVRRVPVSGPRGDPRGGRARVLDGASRAARALPRRTGGGARPLLRRQPASRQLSFALADLPPAIDEAFAAHGWLAW